MSDPKPVFLEPSQPAPKRPELSGTLISDLWNTPPRFYEYPSYPSCLIPWQGSVEATLEVYRVEVIKPCHHGVVILWPTVPDWKIEELYNERLKDQRDRCRWLRDFCDEWSKPWLKRLFAKGLGLLKGK